MAPHVMTSSNFSYRDYPRAAAPAGAIGHSYRALTVFGTTVAVSLAMWAGLVMLVMLAVR